MIAGLAAPILDYFLICFAKNKNELIKRISEHGTEGVEKEAGYLCLVWGKTLR